MEGAGLAAPHETHSGWRARSGAGKAQAWCPECTGGLSSGIKRPRTCPGRAWAYLGYSPWADTRQGGCLGCGQQHRATAGGGNR